MELTYEEKMQQLEEKKLQKLNELDIKLTYSIAGVPCLNCGKPYKPKSITQKFCSGSCRSQFVASKSKKRPYSIADKQCPVCTITFTHKLGHEHGRFCSGRCKNAHLRGKIQERQAEVLKQIKK